MRWHDNGLPGLTFDDVLIRPAYSELNSRQDCNYYTSILGFDHLAPIMAANMITIATVEMADALWPSNIIVPSHRFQSPEQQLAFHIATENSSGDNNFVSIGLNERDRLEVLSELQMEVMLELAHCDSKVAATEVRWLTSQGYTVIAGNVATADACKRLFDAGASMIKVGIGPGSVCTTRLVTGCGVPQLSAIAECAAVGPIIADGGIRNSGDIVKALAAGAQLVMIGSLLAGTDEAAGERLYGYNGTVHKVYYGMASREAGKVSGTNVPEGISATVPYTGPAKAIIQNLIGGIRQGMAMVGARTLQELREKAVFERVTPATAKENHPHIKDR